MLKVDIDKTKTDIDRAVAVFLIKTAMVPVEFGKFKVDHLDVLKEKQETRTYTEAVIKEYYPQYLRKVSLPVMEKEREIIEKMLEEEKGYFYVDENGEIKIKKEGYGLFPFDVSKKQVETKLPFLLEKSKIPEAKVINSLWRAKGKGEISLRWIEQIFGTEYAKKFFGKLQKEFARNEFYRFLANVRLNMIPPLIEQFISEREKGVKQDKNATALALLLTIENPHKRITPLNIFDRLANLNLIDKKTGQIITLEEAYEVFSEEREKLQAGESERFMWKNPLPEITNTHLDFQTATGKLVAIAGTVGQIFPAESFKMLKNLIENTEGFLNLPSR